MKIVIDTDPGVDDALAIFYAAAKPELELLGFTTIFGNVTVKQATRNALHMAERIGRAVPVAEGASVPMALPPFVPSVHVHGPEGFGDHPAPTPAGRALDESAAEFLCRIVRENPGEVTVCPVGPMTNIAAAMELDPDFAKNVGRIVFMGGALDAPGNITPFAEANTYHDPHALDVVLRSGADITMVGLDVTMQVLLTEADFETLAEGRRADTEFLRQIGRFYIGFYHSIGFSGCGLHDPMTIIAALYPEMFTAETTPLEVVTTPTEDVGKTRRSKDRPPVKVLVACDAAAIRKEFFSAFATA